jgi:hypothetical protein
MTRNATPDGRQLALAPLDEKTDHVRGSASTWQHSSASGPTALSLTRTTDVGSDRTALSSGCRRVASRLTRYTRAAPARALLLLQ